MPRIPFPPGFSGAENLPKTNKNLVNCFQDEDGNIISRPGITELSDTSLLARGQFEWNGMLFQVVSTELIRITDTDTGTFETVGTIAGSNEIRTAIGFVNAVIVVRGGNIYSLGKIGTTISISSVGDDGSSVAVFNYTGTNPATGAVLVTGNTVTITGYVTNTAYNVSDEAITSTLSAIASTAITSVADSVANPGTASFVHAGTSPSLGQEVTMSGFTPEITYNATGTVTATTTTTFEVSTIAFTNTDTGAFVATDAFLISSVTFGSSETVGVFAILLAIISTGSNFVACNDLAHINGRFVYIPTDGDPAFFSDVGAAGVVQADAFFDAEELPDLNNGVFNLRNTLYITGTDSIELFRDTGASPNPFIRVQGSRIDNGFIGGLLEWGNTVLFIGRYKDHVPGIFAVGPGVAPKISNSRIDLALTDYTLEELAEVIPGRIIWRGSDIATFALRRDSFGYVNGNWIVLDTSVAGVSQPWNGGYITEFEGEYFSANDSSIGKFERVNKDYDDPINKIIQTVFGSERDLFFSLQSITVGLSQGFNDGVTVTHAGNIDSVEDGTGGAKFIVSGGPTFIVGKSITVAGYSTNVLYNTTAIISVADSEGFELTGVAFGTDESGGLYSAYSTTEYGSVALRMSRNAVQYGPEVYIDLGQIGQYATKLRWNPAGGLGMYNGFAGVEIYTQEDVDFAADTLFAEFR